MKRMRRILSRCGFYRACAELDPVAEMDTLPLFFWIPALRFAAAGMTFSSAEVRAIRGIETPGFVF